jgi:predicted nucleotidyltransferase
MPQINMKEKNKGIDKIKPKIVKILKKHKITRAGIFGSYARGDEKKGSDVDILIQPSKDMSLLDLSGLKIELEEALGKKVDLVIYKYISPYIKKYVLKEEVTIL